MRRMMELRLLADDLTGALDAGAEFARRCGPIQAFWSGGAPTPLRGSVAIDTGTRECDPAAARASVARLAPALAAGGIAYKKVDSLMRGPTVAEVAACFRAGGWRSGVFAPAFPFQRRVTRGGRQWAWSADGWVPAGPPLVQALLGEGVAAQLGRPGAALPPGISVFDAETDDDLDRVVALAPPSVLWCGTGGLARALAGAEAVSSDTLPRPILGLFGSDQPATFAQLEACDPHWTRLAEHGGTGEMAARLAGGLALVTVALAPGLPRDAASLRIARTLQGLARRLPRPGTLIAAGGETLRGLCVALRATSLELEGRILPGLPRAVLRGGDWDGITVVAKSGAFGPAHLLRDLLARNGFYPERKH